MKIAVIGAGVSGMGAALALSETHEVVLFEKDARFGGHANTVSVPHGDGTVEVDTGFIVFNRRNYPNLCALFERLGVESHWSDMSFGFSLKGGGYEYACDDLDRLFAQRSNWANPGHLRMLLDILRFNRTARGELADGALTGLSMGRYLESRRFGRRFRDRFVLPMGGAIWSTPTADVLDFPAENFIAFFENHDLMTGLEPSQRWRTVTGGSQAYVRRLIAELGPRARLGVGAEAVTRGPEGVRVKLDDGSEEVFDQVVLASHAPDGLRMLKDADAEERALLGAFRCSANQAVLHSDPSLMPVRRKAWSSWNFLVDHDRADTDDRPAQVTYWMNRLQGLPEDLQLFVSLNPRRRPAEELVHGTFAYAHPLLDGAAFEAQGRMDAIQGRGGVWHAGAWLGYGFHEDGLRSGLRVADMLGARPDWAVDVGLRRGDLAAAAE